MSPYAKTTLSPYRRLRFVPIEDADPGLLAATELPGYAAHVERIGVIAIEAFDWNCPQHITERFTLEEAAARLKT